LCAEAIKNEEGGRKREGKKQRGRESEKLEGGAYPSTQEKRNPSAHRGWGNSYHMNQEKEGSEGRGE